MPTEDFYVADNTDDGYARGRNTVYLTAWSVCYAADVATPLIGQSYSPRTKLYIVNRTLLRIDTQLLPVGAVISAAKLRVWGSSDSSVTDFLIRIQKWTGDVPIACDDYNEYDAINYDDGLFNTSGFTLNNWNEITLADFDCIVKGNYTLLMLRSSEDDSVSAPTGDEYVMIGDQAENKAAHLRITYTVPAVRRYGDGLTWRR